MSGPIFIILFVLVVLPPVFLISRLKLTDKQKLFYRVLSVVFPIAMFLLSRLVVSEGLITNKVSDQTQLEKALVWLMILSFVFGSWLVLLIASLRQNIQSVSNSEKERGD